MDEAAHNPDAGPFSQAVELLQSIYSDTRHGIPPHWSKQLDLVFFLRKHSPQFMRDMDAQRTRELGQTLKGDARSARERAQTFPQEEDVPHGL